MSRVSKSRTPRTKVYPGFSGSNPFDSDSDSELRPRPPKASSTPVMSSENGGSGASSFYSFTASRNRHKNEFRDSGGLQSQSVQELEGYAVYKAEETTQTVHGALKIAEEIRENAARTLVNLHQQGEQIERTHLSAANIEQDLSRGEKLLGSLGGLFSKTWKPKKTRKIRGPVLIRDESYMRSSNHTEQREKLGISSAPTKSRTKPGQSLPEPTSALEKVQVEKAKQDAALNDLSNLLGDLKNMAVDMGSEFERQNKALDHFDGDVEELNYRVKGANLRGQRLLGRK